MRTTIGCTWTSSETNIAIAKELKVTPILDEKGDYGRNM